MKFLLAVALGASLLVAAHGVRDKGAQAVNPIEKVLSMLSALESKVVKEGEEAQKTYDEFSNWCEERSRNVGFEIKSGKKEVATQKAAIDSAAASISEHNAKIEELGSSISTDDADLKAATKIRTREAVTFKAQEKDLMETIDTLGRAILILEKEMKKKGSAFMQFQKAGSNYLQAISVMVDASMVGTQDASKLTALVQNANAEAESEDDEFAAPAPAKYESHSGGIIETLEDLLEKAKGSLDSARAKESSNTQNFQMLKKSLEDEIKYASKDMADTKKALASTSEAKAVAEGDLNVASKDLAADTSTLSTLHTDCLEGAQAFEAETKSRGEELKALGKAKKVIAESTGGATSQSYGLNQMDFDDTGDDDDLDLAFLQVSQASRNSIRSGTDLANFEAVRLVRDLARRTRSRSLLRLAQRMANVMRHTDVRAGSRDPFRKVKNLIRNMIEKLESEAKADASHKAYCDKELGESQQSKDEKQSTVDKLKAKIDASLSKSNMLKDQVATLQKELADLASTQAEMNDIRSKEKATYTKSKAEMEEGIAGVKTALNVLRDYYAQEDKSHDSSDGAAGGIVGLLEVVESDFTKGLSEMTVAEQTSAKEYERETQSNQIEKARKTQDAKYKKKEAKALDVATSEAKSDRASTQEELDAIMAYLGKLDEICIAKPESYSDRKARREAEIAGLEEALNILNGEMLLQRQAALRGTKLHLK